MLSSYWMNDDHDTTTIHRRRRRRRLKFWDETVFVYARDVNDYVWKANECSIHEIIILQVYYWAVDVSSMCAAVAMVLCLRLSVCCFFLLLFLGVFGVDVFRWFYFHLRYHSCASNEKSHMYSIFIFLFFPIVRLWYYEIVEEEKKKRMHAHERCHKMCDRPIISWNTHNSIGLKPRIHCIHTRTGQWIHIDVCMIILVLDLDASRARVVFTFNWIDAPACMNEPKMHWKRLDQITR